VYYHPRTEWRDIGVMSVMCLLINGGLAQGFLPIGLPGRHQFAAFCIRKEE
jgi:hypothetical protein